MKKSIVILFIVLSNFTFGQTNVKEPIQGTLIGRVTLSVESNLKEIPDGGAKIYIMDSTKENQDIFDETNNVLNAIFYKWIFKEYKSIGKGIVPENIIENVNKYKCNDKAYFDSIDRNISFKHYKLFDSKDVIKLVATESGAYRINLKPSTYFVYFVSKNRKLANYTEVDGLIYCRKIIIKEGESSLFSHKFNDY